MRRPGPGTRADRMRVSSRRSSGAGSGARTRNRRHRDGPGRLGGLRGRIRGTQPPLRLEVLLHARRTGDLARPLPEDLPVALLELPDARLDPPLEAVRFASPGQGEEEGGGAPAADAVGVRARGAPPRP